MQARTPVRTAVHTSGACIVTASCRGTKPRRRTCIRAGNSDDAPSTSGSGNQLELTIRRKQKQLEGVLTELGMETVDERLKSSLQAPVNPPYRLASLISQITEMQGRPALLLELWRPTPTTTADDLAKLAQQYVAAGADALVVRTDVADTPEGLRDLWTVARAVKVPVLGWDWLIHPLQVVEAKEAGAAGMLGVIHQVNGRGTPVMSSFSAAIGMDAPVEVVNAREVDALAKAGVVFYAIGISVGLTVTIPGFLNDVAHGILGMLPFGAISMVGVRSLEDARKARFSGADSLLVKREVQGEFTMNGRVNLRQMMDQLQYATSGDD